MSKKSMAARRQMRDAEAGGGARQQPRGGSRGKNYRRNENRRPWGLIGGVIGVVAAFIIVVVVVESIGSLSQDTSVQPAPSSLVNALTHFPVKELDAVGKGSVDNPPVNIPSSYKPARLTAHGLPEVAFVGAEYCPYCALQRWSLVIALSRFGTWSKLHLIRSSVYDSPANIPSFTFAYGAKYTSSHLVFLGREYQSNVSINHDGAPYRRFQSLPRLIATAFSNIGSAGYPFLDYGGKLASVGSETQSGNVEAMQNLSWDQVLHQLHNTKSTIAQEVLGGANYDAAAICMLTAQKPGSVCKSSAIRTLQAAITSSG
ncbi:MAG: DUF929 family protein [Candidatus Dormibacteria bacterium]